MRPEINMNILTDKNADMLRLILAHDVEIYKLASMAGLSHSGAQYHISILLSVYKVRTRRQLRQLFMKEPVKEPDIVIPRVILRKAGEKGKRERV
jgi:DNA-binding transcriptional ArsR family regulator